MFNYFYQFSPNFVSVCVRVCASVMMFILCTFILLQAEIEKVKKRREERAIEKAQHEEEMVRFFML